MESIKREKEKKKLKKIDDFLPYIPSEAMTISTDEELINKEEESRPKASIKEEQTSVEKPLKKKASTFLHFQLRSKKR